MLVDPHEIICPHHQHIDLLSVSLTIESLTFQEDVLLQIPKYPGIDLNQDDLSTDALGMHDLESQHYVGRKTLLHPSFFVLPAPSKELAQTLQKYDMVTVLQEVEGSLQRV
jgi:hypothetical protein